MEVIQICPACFLLRIPRAGIAWVFNAWPDTVKFLIQQGLDLNGIVCPDLRLQTDKGVSCNLIEFPLLHAIFNQGMYRRGEKPCLVGTPHQLRLAGESFRRGLYGFYDLAEMEGCDLSRAEMKALFQEIQALSLGGIQPIEELVETVTLAPLEECPTVQTATRHRGVRVWKEGINRFAVEYRGEQVIIDCNLQPGQEYEPPLHLDVKQIPFRLFQVIDTGEEDGFSPKSCMHTLIQWRDKIICVDLPMNMTYLLDKVSVSRTEIDAVIFTHNHDDHIGELSMLLQMDRQVTVLCPRIVWKSILLKAAAMFDMEVSELAEYFNHIPLRYGEEYDYGGLRITAHPSIHPVPCAIYRIRGIAGQEWSVYSHMSDILNFQRCQTLLEQGAISRRRFAAYRKFLLAPATVKKVDVGALEGKEEYSVHGSWKDFQNDTSEHIVLAHVRQELLDERATVLVGQFAVAGSARDLAEREGHSYQDKYRERALKYLADYLFALLADRLEQSLVRKHQVLNYLRILADCEIRQIQPKTPFLKMGGPSTFVDMVISGKGSVWTQRGGELTRVATVNAGDVIGDMGALMQVPRTASIRSDTYMHVLRIPGLLFREIAIGLGVVAEEDGEGVIQRIWRNREIVQDSRLFGVEVPIYLQNKIAQRARELRLRQGDCLCLQEEPALFLGGDPDGFAIEFHNRVLLPEASRPPVFGEGSLLNGLPEPYRVVARRAGTVLRLDPGEFGWIREVPIFRLRLKQLAERRAVLAQRAERMG
jgi:CRP-like cAMP-binding protein